MTDSLTRILGRVPGFERELVEKYSRRLLGLARNRLPEQIRKRVDPEDVVQSVYRSFFRRLRAGQLDLNESGAVWHLLAAITYRKVQQAARFHQQQRRDVRRETPLDGSWDASARPRDLPQPEPGPEDLAVLYETLDHFVRRLPASYRDIMSLQLQGHSVDEIAGQVKRSRRTVFRVLAELEELAVSSVESV